MSNPETSRSESRIEAIGDPETFQSRGRTVKQSLSGRKLANDVLDTIRRAGHSISSDARKMLIGARTARCNECCRLIRWWNRRIRDGEYVTHLQCWEGRLFLTALVAEQVRNAQVEGRPISASSPDSSAESGRQVEAAPARLPLDGTVILLQPVQEIAAKTSAHESQSNGRSSLRDLG
jgi:hypothetical protein